MKLCKRKILAFLVLVTLCSSVMFVCSGQSEPNESGKLLFDNSGSSHDGQVKFSAESGENLSTGENPGTRGLFFRMMFMILLFLFL